LITEDHVDFIFGPFGSDLNFAVSPITERYGKVLIDSSGNADRILQQGHKNVFMLIPPASKFIDPFVETLNGLTDPPATLALVSTNSLFGQLQREGFKAHLAEAGKPQLVLDETYASDAKDFTAVISKVVAAKPDVVVNIANIELGTYLTQLRQSGFQPKAWFGSGPPLVDMYKLIKDDALFLFGNSSSWDASVKWCDDIMGCTADIISRHEKMFGDKNVSYFSVNGAGAGVVLVKGIQAAGSIDPAAVRDAIRKLDVELSLGPVKFDDTGSNTAAYAIIQQIKQGGKIDVVYPADRLTGPPVYPLPKW
jgi:branched-chain amino acid transport system substrate-binding protein